MKKVLVILYYWPPAGGSAVQRWLKFSKYLRDYGWEPIIYAPENAQYPETDEELLKEIPEGLKIIRRPILEPFDLYKKFVGIKKEEKLAASMTMKTRPKGFRKIKNDLAFWVRSNFFIPDARCFWIKPSVKFLIKYLIESPVDVIVTTGPPQSLQLIGYHLHKQTGIPWVADFRDPWTSIDFYRELKLTRIADRRHHKLESRVLKTASHVVVIGPNMKEEFSKIVARNISVITNGYDESDLPAGGIKLSEKFTLVHLGTLSATRNAPALWQALADKASDEPQFASDLCIRLVGNIDHSVLESIEALNLRPYLEEAGFVPHREAMEILASSHCLLLLINRSVNSLGVITGKFFEYLASGRPILLIGPPDGDAAAILKETNGGFAAGFDDISTVRSHIDELYKLYQSGKPFQPGKDTAKYSRQALTGELSLLLDSLSGKEGPFPQ